MVVYRRNKLKGGTYFFTVTLSDRNANTLIDYISLLGRCMRQVKKENFYETIAIVVLPAHLHVIWKLPEADSDYSMRWRKIKTYFTKGLLERKIDLIKNKHGEYNVWQRRFWEHTIRDERDLANHIAYIHYNPVKHGLVKNVIDWKYSSFHHYVSEGILSKDWSWSEVKEGNGFGE